MDAGRRVIERRRSPADAPPSGPDVTTDASDGAAGRSREIGSRR
jgi:hypothetical protein